MSTQTEQTAPTTLRAPVRHHWIMTAQAAGGRQGTYDGPIDVHPGHTRTASYSVIRSVVAQEMGTETFTVLFFDMTPDQF
ncbi:hypothetical protein OG946_31230 [Streptomyces sp. NBC_01808]|uniref:hypothetical protein n=1 Tax=Streptomyces sp. NBC_01808 TaxID=2975947 RepID=UPI002DDAA3D0|nr:hypothetical protein [Streptomyces sp. NBC_01808]WSA41465.1 hypothetical protein OG946_31230 [Streptomyces sp. NBC_01808]